LVTATDLAAFYLGYRRICLVVLSPVGGWIGDTFGLERAFNISLAMMLGGLLILASGYIALGYVIVFTSYSVNAAITPGTASASRDHSLTAVAENTTWRDLGAATGTLAGGVLTASPYLMNILFIAIFGLTILLCIRRGTGKKALKLLYLWR